MGISVQTKMANIVVRILLGNLSRVRVIEGAESEFHDLLDVVRQLDERLLYDGAKENESLSEQIIELADKSEDVIDNFLVQRRKLYNRVKALLGPDVKKHINDLSTEIKDIVDYMTRPLDVTPLPLPPTQTSFLTLDSLSGQELCADYVGNKPIGFDMEREIVIKRLVEGSKKLDIIPIVAMVGLGKTTLAKLIYNDSRISLEFSSCLWIHVDQLDRRDIFLCILEELGKNREEYEDKDVSELRSKICDFLAERGGRCFIVMDDVRTSEDIDLFRTLIPENGEGHRILLTTCIKDVAAHASANPHHLKFLSEEESFQLFDTSVFGWQGVCPAELAKLRESIARQCSGIPLLLSIVAGSLRGDMDKICWQDIEGYIRGHPINRDDPASLLTSVNLSYNTMPLEMQVCFLYFGIFPRGFDIPVWKLIRLWIGEGLITISDSVSSLLEERAESCLNSLVDRNLVMVLQKSCDGRIKVCRVQDLMYAFCKSMAEKWFSQHVSKDDIARQVTARRLCIQTSALNNFFSAKPVANHVRSFYCFSSRRSQKELSDSKLIYEAFPLIRVLDIEPLNFVYSKKFFQLFHLRYVAVSGDFVDVPKAIDDMSNLQTLILHTTAQITFLEIKANIWKLLHLRHVHTNIPAKLRPSPKSKGKDHCLQTLSVVAPESCSKDVFSKACNLKKVGIRGNLEDFLDTSNGGLKNLEELKYLKHLKLYNEGGVLSRALHLPQSYYNFLNTLKKLTLCNTRFDWNNTNMLGMLGSLEVLKLKEHAFGGRLWEAGSGHFRQLQVLWIENSDLQVWEASERHFPRLRHLILKHCPNLEIVPYELAEVSSLQEIRLENTHKAVDSVRKIERKKLESIKFKLTILPPNTNVEICVQGDN